MYNNMGKKNREIVVIETNEEEAEDEPDIPRVVLRNKVVRPVAGAVRRTLLNIKNHEYEANSAFLFSYLTIKVLFWDIGIAFGDTVTDFCQGVALLFTPGMEIYGIITLAINWVPGIPAAVHLLSMYRRKLPWQKALLYALLLILLYPIVPIVAYVNLLWKKPTDPNTFSKGFREAEYLATIAHAISGGIESPVQLMFQCWLIFNGIIRIDWTQVLSFGLSDWQGNTIYLPVTASASLIFSVVSILKASVELNIVRVHVQDISSWKQGLRFAESMFDHLPFIAAEAFFRIVAIIFCMTYLNSFGFLPIGAFWISTIIVGQRIYLTSMEHIPLWLISFISIFIPVCFTTQDVRTEEERQKIIHLQYQTFKYFSMSAFLLYGAALAGIGVIVNLPLESTNFQYSPGVILTHLEFNVLLGSLGAMGCLATLMSFWPTITFILHGRPAKPQKSQIVDDADATQPCLPDIINFVDLSRFEPRERLLQRNVSKKKNKCSSVIFILIRVLATLLVFSPLFVPLVFLAENQRNDCYINHSPSSNASLTVKAIPITKTLRDIRGISKLYSGIDSKTEEISSLQFILPSAENVETVAVITRTDWESRSEKLLISSASAIIILDDKNFRPSSPLPKLFTDNFRTDLPMVLVRQEDSAHFRVKDGTRISISSTAPSPEPPWKCSPSGCLPPVFNGTNIAGTQYRTKLCYWGGEACVGHDNEQQFERFCNGSDTQICPLNGQEYGVFQSFSLFGAKRTFRSSPSSCVAYNNFEDSISECDNGATSWSQWLEWQTHWQDGDIMYRSSRRYCYLKLVSCIFEEQHGDKCCSSECGDPELKRCQSAVII